MKKLLTLLLLLGTSLINYGQDTLYLKNGDRIIVEISEITPTQIKYKNWPAESGPLYVILHETVEKIIDKSGKLLKFSTAPVQPPVSATKNPKASKVDLLPKGHGQNMISLKISDIFFDQLTISYERTLKTGLFVLHIPLSIGMVPLGLSDTFPNARYYGYYCPNKLFSTGIDLHIYPAGQGTIRAYIGPSLEYGRVLRYYSMYNQYSQYPYEAAYYPGHYFSIIVQTGVLFQLSKNINIATNLGAGYSESKFKMPNNYPVETRNFAFRCGVSAGYRF